MHPCAFHRQRSLKNSSRSSAWNPYIGRVFSEEDGDRVTVINHEVWRGRFGADPSVLGTTVRLSDVDYTIIGVMPATFRFELEATETTLGVEADFWRPLAVIGFFVSERNREMGLRLALGASPIEVMSVVMGRAMALLACYLPARRASRVDPAWVLRSE